MKTNVKDFLVELQKEMLTQETDGQASPRFWTIMDYRWVEATYDSAQRVALYSPSVAEVETIESYVEIIEEEMEDYEIEEEDLEELKEHVKYNDYDEILNWIHENDREDYELIYEKEESYIKPDLFFITKKDALKHLKGNSHHYTAKAHTYAMTAWRSGKVAKLYEVLEKTDWEKVDFGNQEALESI